MAEDDAVAEKDAVAEDDVAETGQLRRLLTALLAFSVLLGVLGAGLTLPVAGAVGGGLNAGSAILGTLPSTLADPALPQTSVMLAADGTRIASFYDENRTEVTLDQVSPWVQMAVVAVEDSRFYRHGGVDPRGVLRAFVNNQSGGSTQGASTITQQYVKNALLESAIAAGDSARARAVTAATIRRKLVEMSLATSLEQRLTKRQILQRYLNIVYFADRTYGIEAAARRYFQVPASQVTLAQAATLAGMVQDAGAFSPRLHPVASTNRRNLVLRDMLKQQMITQAQYQQAVAAPTRVPGHTLPSGCLSSGTSASFCEYVLRSLLTDPRYTALGATASRRAQAVLRGGLVVRTTLDPRAQAGVAAAVQRGIPADDSSGLAAAAVTVEPGTGKVVAMAQDRAYSINPGRGRTSVNYAVDHDLGGATGFQTGSSFKPFTLAAWLSSGRGLDDTVDATARDFPFSGFTACGRHLRGTKAYSPGNSEGTETGPMSVVQATYNSVNVAYVDMESQLDLCRIAGTAEALGIHLAAARQECETDGRPTTQLATCVPSLTLGVEAIAPLTMAAAYAGFASGGLYCAPLAVTQLSRALPSGTDRAAVGVPGADCRRALDPTVASGVTRALTQVLTQGTAAGVGPLDPWPSAGKTGTTDGPYDTWFVGYTAQRSTAVWVGDPGRVGGGGTTRRRLTGITVNGEYHDIVFGATIAAPIWKDAMTTVMNGLPAVPLP